MPATICLPAYQSDSIIAVSPDNEQTSSDVEYNERFWWRSSGEMTSAFKQALYQGAPFPIVSLAEYFSLHQEGFSWGSRYREAGYYASIMLWYIISKSIFIEILSRVLQFPT